MVGRPGHRRDDLRNGAQLGSGTINDGVHADRLGRNVSGSYNYQICETGGAPCSNASVVVF